MEALVADAKEKGARVMTGGARIGNRGNFYPLTVLADVRDEAHSMREEAVRAAHPVEPPAQPRRGDREGELGDP